jgi:hypothetical protein
VLGTFARQGKRLDKNAVDEILFGYADEGNSYAFTAHCEGRAIAACFVVHDQRTAYYLMGGYDERAGHHAAGPAAMFAAIRHAREMGLETFDFEGSVIPPIERYFRGFGGRLTPYLTVNRAWLPIEMLLKLRKRTLF